MAILNYYILGVAVVFLILIIIACIYFLAYYAHPNDTPFGSSKLMRAFVVI